MTNVALYMFSFKYSVLPMLLFPNDSIDLNMNDHDHKN